MFSVSVFSVWLAVLDSKDGIIQEQTETYILTAGTGAYLNFPNVEVNENNLYVCLIFVGFSLCFLYL